MAQTERKVRSDLTDEERARLQKYGAIAFKSARSGTATAIITAIDFIKNLSHTERPRFHHTAQHRAITTAVLHLVDKQPTIRVPKYRLRIFFGCRK